MKIDLKSKPFYLSDEDIKWVEDTLAGLTLDEKIGQVFVDMLWNNTEEEIKERIAKYGMSGFRYNNMPAADLHRQNAVIQDNSCKYRSRWRWWSRWWNTLWISRCNRCYTR